MKSTYTAAILCLCAAPSFGDTGAGALHDIAHFFEDANVVAGPEVVDCTLSGGAKTQCFKITVKAEPKAYAPGPWCPSSIEDTAEAGGIWLQDGVVHDVDGDFIEGLAAFYDDPVWQVFDPDTGQVRVTDTKPSCEAAARPDVDPEYNNYCVQCLPEYMEDGATVTYTIPLEPVAAERPTPTNFTGSGIAYNGIRLDGPAPVEDILGAHTIAPFDDCGGHVNTHVGYHYHAVTDCLPGAPVAAEAPDAALIGIAMDGFQIFAHLLNDGSEPEGLDICNGHADENGVYHYHAGAAGSNAILGCMTAQAGCASENPDAVCDASKRPPRP